MNTVVHSAADLRALGKTFALSGDLQSAVLNYERALALAPGDNALLYDLAAAHHSLRNYSRARGLYEKLILSKPYQAAAYNDFGMLCREVGDFDKSFELFCAAAERDPRNAIIASNLGGSLLERGRIAEARASYQQAVDLAPSNGRYLYQLAELASFSAGDPRLQHMLDLVENERVLALEDRIGLHFALGKALADVGQHPLAFDQYQAGNQLKRSQIDYDETAAISQMNEAPAAISKPLFEHLRHLGTSRESPIFIVGMLRSGSTLLKQVLARHPTVDAAGEVTYFSDSLSTILRRRNPKPLHLQDFLETMSRVEVQELAELYLAKFRSRPGDGRRTVDKALTNFRFIGLIKAVFPNARIIHVFRNALDTCWSCYSKLFAEPQPFSYDLAELGRYYSAYRGVMEHWRRVLPQNAFIEMRYEDLVGDFEQSCRRLLDFCGLPWDDRCLSFYEGQNLVKTSSAVQLRQPLFSTGVGRSAPFVPQLTPLVRALGCSAVT